MNGGLAAKRNFGAINSEDPRVTARGAASGNHSGAGHKAQFHQASSCVFRKIEAIQDRLFSLFQIAYMQGSRWCARVRCLFAPLETELHVNFSIKSSAIRCQVPSTKRNQYLPSGCRGGLKRGMAQPSCIS